MKIIYMVQVNEKWELIEETLKNKIIQIDTLINSCESIKTFSRHESKYRDIDDQRIVLSNQINEYIRLNINIGDIPIHKMFSELSNNVSDIISGNVSYQRGSVLEKLISLKSNTIYILNLFQACDLVTNPSEQLQIERAKLKTKNILSFILEKLYHLYDDEYYHIDPLLIGNGISVKRKDDPIHLCKLLEDKGLVELNKNNKSKVRLTMTGKIDYEKKLEVEESTYDNINYNSASISLAIEKLKDDLQNLGYGQEVIFNEIDELKELTKYLNKKNWGQILKGKLFDLGLSEVVSHDVIYHIYQSLTNTTLHLP